jgi:hypothetical protein
MTDCADDVKMQHLIAEFGTQGYAAYWLIIERIGKEFDGVSCKESLTLPTKFWQKITFFSPKKYKNFLFFCKKISLLNFVEDGKNITVIVPNLLKYGDEYSKKQSRNPPSSQVDLSGQSPPASISNSPSPRKDIFNTSNTNGVIDTKTGEVMQ